MVLRRVDISDTEFQSSNIYSTQELGLLQWCNDIYKTSEIWPEYSLPSRWIVNFDHDWSDGFILAAILAKFCPFLIESHLTKMCQNPFSPELCLHNTLIVTGKTDAINDKKL